jgi:hypothetical protein
LTVDDTTATSLYLTDDHVADSINNLYNSGKITVSSAAAPFPRPTGVPSLLHGDGSPEGLVYAPQGSLYMRRDGTGVNSLYIKTTGITVNTGWESFGAAIGGAGVELAYGQITSSVSVPTSATEASPVDVVTAPTFTADGAPVMVEFFTSSVGGGNGAWPTLGLNVWLDGVDQGRIYLNAQGNSLGAMSFGAFTGEMRLTPGAGSRVFKIRAWATVVAQSIHAGAGGAGTYAPAFLRITKV